MGWMDDLFPSDSYISLTWLSKVVLVNFLIHKFLDT